MYTDMPKDNILLLRLLGGFVDIMYKVKPEHKKNVIYENGKKVLYLSLVRVSYLCI